MTDELGAALLADLEQAGDDRAGDGGGAKQQQQAHVAGRNGDIDDLLDETRRREVQGGGSDDAQPDPRRPPAIRSDEREDPPQRGGFDCRKLPGIEGCLTEMFQRDAAQVPRHLKMRRTIPRIAPGCVDLTST